MNYQKELTPIASNTNTEIYLQTDKCNRLNMSQTSRTGKGKIKMRNTIKLLSGETLKFCGIVKISGQEFINWMFLESFYFFKNKLTVYRQYASNFKILKTAIVFLCLTIVIQAQANLEPKRGIQPNTSYLSGDIETVSTTTGNVMFNIPLASLPVGRGGNTGRSLSLIYNSKILDPEPSVEPSGSGSGSVLKTYLKVNDSGGWRYNLRYALEVIDKRYEYHNAYPNPYPCGQDSSDPAYYTAGDLIRVRMRFPDGGTHEFLPAFQANQDESYYNRDPEGRIYYCVGGGQAVPYLTNSDPDYTPKTYYSGDGSHLRLDITFGAPDANGFRSRNWTLSFPDGTRVVVDNSGTINGGDQQFTYDRNGNYTVIESSTYNGQAVTRVGDQLGRSIFLQKDGATDYIYAFGTSGEELKWTVKWKTIVINKTYCPTRYYASCTTPISTSPSLTVVDQIVSPTQLGSQTYNFAYNWDANNPAASGWGEVNSVTLPTGAKAEYKYRSDGADDTISAETVLKNYPTEKKLSYSSEYDGVKEPRTEIWKYDSSLESGHSNSVIMPDGGQIIENVISRDDNPPLAGLVKSTQQPDGSIVERIWKDFDPTGLTRQYYINPYVKTEYFSIKDAAGNLSQTAIKDYEYDQNGNVTQVKEYDWMPYSSVPRSTNTSDPNYGQPTGIPGTAPLKRITFNTYNNPSPSVASTQGNANSYWQATAPQIRNSIASTEITDGSGNQVSRTEFLYDNPATTGNPIEIKMWDSSKGAYSSPLTSSNSISVSNQYDAYGNLTQTADAKGIVSKLTYGNITTPSGTVSALYPTQSVSAYGTAEARIAQTEYDFSTGAVTKITDADNNVSTETEYDALARPVKVKAAVGTANEVWTQTQYDDIARRIISKSDIDAKGDGRKVAIQHFDQLGRIRLTRTLEDAATQSATNEADGIKVQTRYAYDNPTDPANSNGSYSLTSNPYRAATAAQAASEEAMGWTLGYTDKTGKTSTTKTYGGAALPAPFGANTNLTGTVSTAIDANATTVTDQAGKQRRSITNGIGQLSRVDEPDNAGNLGTIANPNQPTNYLYDTSGKLVKVTQGVQSRYFKYDSLGRLLRIRQPEQGTNASLALADATTGNSDWSAGFTYDANGNLVTATDTRGTVITNAYDNLNRPLTRNYSDATPAVTYAYDNPNIQFSKGRLTRVSNSVSTSQILSLDNLGRTLSSRQTTDGNNYDSAYTYNLAGGLLEETYPSGRKVKNSFQADGNLAKIETLPAGGSYQMRAQNFAYSAAGAISALQIGSGKWESAQFNSRLQVTQLGLGNSASDQSLWKLNYDFGTTNNNGNVLSQTATVPSINPLTQTYTYDSLNRLKSAVETQNSSQTFKQTFTYDRYGNRQFDAANTTTLGSCPANECNPAFDANTNRITSAGYTYDLAGNIITDAQGRQFTFNGDNKQTQVKDASNNVIGQYFYDGDGKRIKKITNSENTTFVYSGGKLVAEYQLTTATPSAPTTQYITTDMLGSPRVISDGSGNIVSRRDFMPFGEELNGLGNRSASVGYNADSIRQKFTGYQRDAETNLDFAEARYYNSSNGRFTAVDPLLASGKSANPQSFNRYAYTLNNPLRLIDKSGLQAGADEDEVIVADPTTYFGSFVEALRYYTARGIAFVANSDPLQNANYQRFQNRINAANGDSEAMDNLDRKLFPGGPTVDSVLQQTQDSYKAAQWIGETNLIIQNLLLLAPIPSGSNPVTTNIGTPMSGQIPTPSGEGTIFTHFTDENGVQGITGLNPSELQIGRPVGVNQLNFGTGQNSFLNSGAGENHITDLGINSSEGQLNSIGVFRSSGRQQFGIQMSHECLFCNGARPVQVRPNNFTIPANTTLTDGIFTVTRRY